MLVPFRDYNPSRTFPLVTVSLVVLNTLVFLYMASLAAESESALNAFVMHAAVIPAELVGRDLPGVTPLQPVWLTLFTAMFMHAGPLHLVGNMLFLWIFGNNIEDAMGSFRFLMFYLLCGVLATLAYIFMLTNSLPADSPVLAVPMLGASGAIAGVLGAYLVRYPFAQVDSCLFLFIFVTVVRLPALIVLAFWFILQLFNGTASLTQTTATGGVAYWAHVGGFVAGMILVNLFARPRASRY